MRAPHLVPLLLAPVQDPRVRVKQLRQQLATALHLAERAAPPHHRVLRSQRVSGHAMSRYAVETGGTIRAILHKRLLDPAHAQTLDVENALYLLDARGLGESRPDEARGDFFHPYGMDYMFHGHELLFGASYLGRRVHDVLSTLDLLAAEGAGSVALYGRGQGALLALFAALLHDSVGPVTLKNAPLSYHAMTQTPLPAWPVANFVRGVLGRFDLPDCYRALGKRLTLLQPWNASMKPLRSAALKKALSEAGLSGRPG